MGKGKLSPPHSWTKGCFPDMRLMYIYRIEQVRIVFAPFYKTASRLIMLDCLNPVNPLGLTNTAPVEQSDRICAPGTTMPLLKLNSVKGTLSLSLWLSSSPGRPVDGIVFIGIRFCPCVKNMPSLLTLRVILSSVLSCFNRTSACPFTKMRKNHFNACTPKKARHIMAMPGLSQGKRGSPKVSISFQHNPRTPVHANYKPRAQLTLADPSILEKGLPSTSTEMTSHPFAWDSLSDEPPVIIHDMNFEPDSGWKHSTKVNN